MRPDRHNPARARDAHPAHTTPHTHTHTRHPVASLSLFALPTAPERGVGRPPRNGPPPSEHEV
eukprot:scaffold12304_cov121-Isochrysis_galbana.AAC.10